MYQIEISDSPGHSSGSPRSAGLSDGYVEVEIEATPYTYITNNWGVPKKPECVPGQGLVYYKNKNKVSIQTKNVSIKKKEYYKNPN